MTGELLDRSGATAEQARQLTDRIKIAVEAIWHLIAEAYQSRAWAALGYASWDDYTTREFGTARLRLPAEDRREVVGSLREAGLSYPAIAAATGLGLGTVHRASTIPNGKVDAPLVWPEDVAAELDGSVEPAPPSDIPSPTTTGTNGKTYQRPPTPAVAETDPFSSWSQDERDLLKRLRDGETIVVNMRGDGHSRLWAWAEQSGLAVRIDRKSIWGNPFITPDDGTRNEVCDNFADMYWPHKPSLHEQVASLQGKALGCWCAPARCHGDQLAMYAFDIDPSGTPSAEWSC